MVKVSLSKSIVLKYIYDSIQNELVSQRITTDDYNEINLIAGCDISFYKENDEDAVVCIVVMKYPSLETVYSTCRRGNYNYYKDITLLPLIEKLTQPYIPNFLAFREADLIINLIKEIPPEASPDLLLIDGNGTLHPLKFGIACHLGVLLDIPTIGVAKNFLQIAEDGLFIKEIKEKSKMLTKPGDFFEIVGKGSKFVYGAALIPVKNCSNPIFVSPGNRVSLAMAIEFVVKTSKYRVPEPIRHADLMSRQKVKDEKFVEDI